MNFQNHHRTINKKICENWVFTLKMYQFVREIWVAADFI